MPIYWSDRHDDHPTDERFTDVVRLCPICGESMLIQVDHADDTEDMSPRSTLALSWVHGQEWCHTICVENQRETAADADLDELIAEKIARDEREVADDTDEERS